MVVPGKPFVQARGGRRSVASAGRARPFVTPVWGTMEAASASAHWPIRPGHAPPARQLRHAAGACSHFFLTLPVLARWDQATQTGMGPMNQVEILEVAPRDGFQAVKPFIPTETKIALIEQLAACGFKRLEIGSFVSPKAIPQLADTARDPATRAAAEGPAHPGARPQRQGPGDGARGGRARDHLGDLGVGEPQPRQRQPQRRRELPRLRGGVGRARPRQAEAAAGRCRPASTARGRAASPRNAYSRWSSAPSPRRPRWRSPSAIPPAAPRPITSARCSAG